MNASIHYAATRHFPAEMTCHGALSPPLCCRPPRRQYRAPEQSPHHVAILSRLVSIIHAQGHCHARRRNHNSSENGNMLVSIIHVCITRPTCSLHRIPLNSRSGTTLRWPSTRVVSAPDPERDLILRSTPTWPVLGLGSQQRVEPVYQHVNITEG